MKQAMTGLEGGAQSLYALITPIIESKKLRTVSEEQAHEILKSGGIAEAIGKISKTDLGFHLIENFRETMSAKDVELSSWRFLASELHKIYGNLPKQAKLIIDYYLNRYDVLNLKAVIRRILCNVVEPVTGMPLGSICLRGRLADLLICRSEEEVCRLLHSLSMRKYAEIVERTKDRMSLEIALEAEYFSNLSRISRKIKDERVSHFIGTLIDLTNILMILRSVIRRRGVKRQELLSESYMLNPRQLEECCTCNSLDAFLTMLGRTYYFRLGARLNESYMLNRDVSLLENITNQYLNYVAKAVFFASAFTPGYVLDYVLLRENEVRLVTTALKMVEEQMPYDRYARYFAGGKV